MKTLFKSILLTLVISGSTAGASFSATDPIEAKEIKEKNQELFQMVHEGFEGDEFLSLYSSVKQAIAEKRQMKKNQSKLLAVSDPGLAISIKLKRRLRKKLHSKAKIQTFGKRRKSN